MWFIHVWNAAKIIFRVDDRNGEMQVNGELKMQQVSHPEQIKSYG